MPKFIRSTKTITEQAKFIEDNPPAFYHVPQNFRRDKDLAYTAIYLMARQYVGNPRDLVHVAKQIPSIWNAALSLIQARQNKDKEQTKRMNTLIRQAVKELADYYKAKDTQNHFANLQADTTQKTPEELKQDAEENERHMFAYRRAKIEARNRKGKNPWD